MYNASISDNFRSYAKLFIEQANAGMTRDEYPFILTRSGLEYRHGWPDVKDISINDIAHSLSRICRFTGHVECPLYSVAEHSVRVSYACDPQDAFWGLLHDATEAYVTDMARPLKNAPGMEVYKHYEALTAAAVAERFKLDPQEPESVRRADYQLCLTEMRDLFVCPEALAWALQASEQLDLPLLKDRIVPWTQPEAQGKFLNRFYQLELINWRDSQTQLQWRDQMRDNLLTFPPKGERRTNEQEQEQVQ